MDVRQVFDRAKIELMHELTIDKAIEYSALERIYRAQFSP
jgi:hypothetical protein